MSVEVRSCTEIVLNETEFNLLSFVRWDVPIKTVPSAVFAVVRFFPWRNFPQGGRRAIEPSREGHVDVADTQNLAPVSKTDKRKISLVILTGLGLLTAAYQPNEPN